MAEREIVVTGANSPLAQALIERFLRKFPGRLVGIVSPRGDPSALKGSKDMIRYLQADLESDLPEVVSKALKRAHSVLHMAWVRGTDPDSVTERNLRIAERLVAAMGDPQKLYLLSTIAAGRDAPSAYGRAKFVTGQWIRSQGGNVLVCGLVISDPPLTAFKTLSDVAEQFPISLRFWAGKTTIYPIAIADLEAALGMILETKPTLGTAALFLPKGVQANDFMRWIEAKHPRPRVPVWLPNKPFLAMAKVGRYSPLKGLSEKIATFLYLDEQRLGAMKPAPGTDLAHTRAAARRIG